MEFLHIYHSYNCFLLFLTQGSALVFKQVSLPIFIADGCVMNNGSLTFHCDFPKHMYSTDFVTEFAVACSLSRVHHPISQRQLRSRTSPFLGFGAGFRNTWLRSRDVLPPLPKPCWPTCRSQSSFCDNRGSSHMQTHKGIRKLAPHRSSSPPYRYYCLFPISNTFLPLVASFLSACGIQHHYNNLKNLRSRIQSSLWDP